MSGSVAVAVLGAALGDWSDGSPAAAASALGNVFLALVPVCAIGIALALRLEHRPLADSVGDDGQGGKRSE